MAEKSMDWMVQEVDNDLCEDYWPVDKVSKWIEIVKFCEKMGDKKGANEIRKELDLLNRTCIMPADEISDIWKWCKEHLSNPFPSWKHEAVEYYQKRLVNTKNPLHEARYAYALWTLEKRIEYGELSAVSFLEAGKSLIAARCYSQGLGFETCTFCFEFAARLSLTLKLKKPSIIEVASGLQWATNELLKEGVKGVETRYLVHALAELAQDTFRNAEIRNGKEFTDIVERILEISRSIAEEWHERKEFHFQRSYYEDCLALCHFLRREEEAKRILISIAQSHVEEAEGRSASKITQQLLYNKALQIYADLGLQENVVEIKKRISQCEREADEKGEYKTYVVRTEIPFQFAKSYAEKLRGSPETILRALIEDPKLIPNKDHVIKRTSEMAEKYPLSFVTPIQLMGRDGPIESFNIEKEILDYKTREQFDLEAQLLEAAITSVFSILLKDRLKPTDISSFIFAGRNINDNMRRIIEIGVKSHFDRNYVSAISVMIPQMEELLRNLLRNHGITTTKYDQRRSGIEQALLGTLIDKAEPILGCDFAEYLRIRFSTRYANIRNKVCHGWMKIEEFSESLSTALIFVILKLSNA